MIFSHVAVLSSLADKSSARDKGRAAMSAIADTFAMGNLAAKLDLETIRGRLTDAIKKKGMSNRELSLKAGYGQGYVHSILVEKKEPGVSRLARVCAELDVSLFYILYGMEISPETEEIISRLESNPQKRDSILGLLEN